jgi:Domain of unknown function (DUF4340)
MKLKQSTWGLIFAAILLGGFVYVFEIEGRPQREAKKNQKNDLFAFEEKDVQSVTLKTKDQTLLFERNSQTQPKWLMTIQPQKTKVPANEAYVVYLLDQLAKGEAQTITPDPRIDYGLNEPQATIEIKLNNGGIHQLIIGKPNFNNSLLYAIADTPTAKNQPSQILLVSTNFSNAVNRPLSDWQQPAQTSQPPKNPQNQQNSPSPTATPSPKTTVNSEQ